MKAFKNPKDEGAWIRFAAGAAANPSLSALFAAEKADILLDELRKRRFKQVAVAPVPVALYCPECRQQHVDEGEWAIRPHKTHRCVAGPFGKGCGYEWQPFGVHTVGVATAAEFGPKETAHE